MAEFQPPGYQTRSPDIAELGSWLTAIGRMGAALWRGGAYVARRTREDPSVGAAYLGAGLLVGLLALDFWEGLACSFTWPLSHGPRPATWFLTDVLPLAWVGACLAGIAAAGGWDWWRRGHGPRPKAPLTRAAVPDVCGDPTRWVLGRQMARPWDMEAGAFRLSRTPVLYTLGPEHLPTHVLVVGPTGSGKTYLLRQLLHMTRRVDASVLVWDYKNQGFAGEYFDRTFSITPQAGSLEINYVAGLTPQTVGELLAVALLAAVPNDDWYFKQNAQMALPILVVAFHKAYGAFPLLTQLVHYLRDEGARVALLGDLETSVGLTDPSYGDIKRLNELVNDKRQGNLLGTLEAALTPAARELDGVLVTEGGTSMHDLVRHPGSTRLALTVAEHPLSGPLAGQLLLSLFIHAVPRKPVAERAHLSVAILDEAHYAVQDERVAPGLATLREYGGCLVLSFQTLQQIRERTLRQQVFDIPGTRIALPGLGKEDEALFRESVGQREQLYVQRSWVRSEGQSASRVAGRSASRGQGASSQVSENTTQVRRVRWDWLPGELHNLPAHHGLVLSRDKTGWAQPATVVCFEQAELETSLILQAMRRWGHLGGTADEGGRRQAEGGITTGANASVLSTPPSAVRLPYSELPPGLSLPVVAEGEEVVWPHLDPRAHLLGRGGSGEAGPGSAPAAQGGAKKAKGAGQGKGAAAAGGGQTRMFDEGAGAAEAEAAQAAAAATAAALAGAAAPAPALGAVAAPLPPRGGGAGAGGRDAAPPPAAPPPAAPQSAEAQIDYLAEVLRTALRDPGLTAQTARNLAAQAVKDGRDAPYIRHLVQQVKQMADIDRPTGVVWILLSHNLTLETWLQRRTKEQARNPAPAPRAGNGAATVLPGVPPAEATTSAPPAAREPAAGPGRDPEGDSPELGEPRTEGGRDV